MHLLHSRNPWFYRMDFDIMIDFCIWVLQVDGLHTPPFDQHPHGDGSLRAAGLTAENWQTWLLQVIPQQNEFKQALQQQTQADPLNPLKDTSTRRFPELRYPPAVWSGSDAVRKRLLELWEQFGPISNQRKRREPEFSRTLLKAERTSGKRLYDELKAYHTRIPPLSIYLVEYDRPLDYLRRPATLLMTQQEGQPSPEEFRVRVLEAVAELATPPDRRRKTSPYVSVGGNNASQFAPVYRGYIRKPAPPSPPKQIIPTLTDPVKQIIVNELENEYSPYGIVDLTTVQFLREKNKPGWRFYELTFQEIDGEPHRTIFILQQNEDGSWRYRGSSSSSDVQKQWPNIFAPVHDHPLLFLNIQTGGSSDNRHFLHAHGDVIDNGFHVERVRLITQAGQIFEDIVENGYVFFAYEQEQPLSLPMQAELYDNKGKLVWRQTVPDHSLPPWFKLRRQ